MAGEFLIHVDKCRLSGIVGILAEKEKLKAAYMSGNFLFFNIIDMKSLFGF